MDPHNNQSHNTTTHAGFNRPYVQLRRIGASSTDDYDGTGAIERGDGGRTITSTGAADETRREPSASASATTREPSAARRQPPASPGSPADRKDQQTDETEKEVGSPTRDSVHLIEEEGDISSFIYPNLN